MGRDDRPSGPWSVAAARLGHPKAAEAQDAADRARPDSLPRFATHIQLHRALAMTVTGDHAEGLAHAQAAMDALPAERHSLSLRMMLSEIQQAAG